jgi:hypothetical protein
MSVVVSDIQMDFATVYYKVFARSAKGLSTPRTYKITNTIVPTIWGPGSGQSFAESVPYSIAGKSGSADMEFHVAKDAAFSKLDGVFVSANGGNTGNLPVSGPGDYYFRVRYINARSKGTWSVTVPFKITKVSEMAPPLLRSPANVTTNVDSKNSQFVWNPVPGATQYLISVFQTSSGKLLYQNFTDTTSIWVANLPANLACQWTVLAMGDKISKQYSATWKFTTNAMVSNDPTLQQGAQSQWLLYPIPASQTLWLGNLNGNDLTSLQVIDALGKVVCTGQSAALQDASNGAIGMDVSGLKPGIYFVRLGAETQQFVVLR